MATLHKTMTPKHAPPCRTCRGFGKVRRDGKAASAADEEKAIKCPSCGGTGKGKMAQK